MRIGINLVYLIPGKVGGTETYARELIPVLAHNNQLVLFCGQETAPTFACDENIEIVTLPINSTNRIMRILAEQTLLPLLCRKYKIDVLFSLGYSAPVFHPCPSVVTIHDLNWYYHAEDFSLLNSFFWQYLTRASAHFSDHIITDSRASAKSIIEVLGVVPSKVAPILHGTPSKLKVKPYKSKNPYIFTVVANYPHKNLSTLLKAFDIISPSFPGLNLLVCGLGNRAKSSRRVKYLGYVSREELCSLYMGASVFVFPSAYEGFGYPVLEAMSYGTPVVSSNAFSLSEVVGEGGVQVSPYEVDDYVTAISKIIRSGKQRAKLVKLGTHRASELKWDDTARITLKVLQKTTKI
jgi:glycosyltransferase involved in cell wall biosynthesis